jgi:hypothetical protein
MLRVAMALGAGLVIAGAVPAHAGMGAQFGTRDPITCYANQSAPQNGPLNANTAIYYAGCSYEYYDEHNGQLYLTDITPLAVGAPRPFNLDTDPSAADSDYPVQDIEAQEFITYSCEPLNGSNAGTNCHTADAQAAAGFCYRKRDRNWECVLNPDPRRFNQFEGPGPHD